MLFSRELWCGLKKMSWIFFFLIDEVHIKYEFCLVFDFVTKLGLTWFLNDVCVFVIGFISKKCLVPRLFYKIWWTSCLFQVIAWLCECRSKNTGQKMQVKKVLKFRTFELWINKKCVKMTILWNFRWSTHRTKKK